MRWGRLNHVGLAVPDLAAAMAAWRERVGAAAVGEVIDAPDHGVRVCFVDLGDGEVELLAPLGDASPLADFLRRQPAGGQHHLCFEVPDIAAARAWCEGRGWMPLGPTRIGAHGVPIFFLHPRDCGGVLTELMEAPPRGH